MRGGGGPFEADEPALDRKKEGLAESGDVGEDAFNVGSDQ